VNRFLTRPGPARWALGGGLVALLALVLFLWWRDAPPPAPPLLSLLPRGSVVTSQARVDLDGRRPFEIAATVYIPAFPGAAADLGHAVLAGYDHWGTAGASRSCCLCPRFPRRCRLGRS